jgi:hypothetical protein
MVGHHAGDLPRMHTPGATCEHLPFPAPQPTDRHLALDQLHGQPGGERGAAACTHAKQRQVWRRPSCEPRTANVRPSLARQARFGRRRPSRSPTTATRRTRCSNRGRSRRTDVFRIQRGCSGRGHRTGVRTDTRITGRADTGRPGQRTSTRPVGRTSVRTADSGRGQGDERRGRRPNVLDGHDDGDRLLGGPKLARVAASAALATHDGSAVTTPAAAVTGQLRSTARHEAAPRRAAVLRRLRVESRAERWRSSVMAATIWGAGVAMSDVALYAAGGRPWTAGSECKVACCHGCADAPEAASR